MLLNVRSVRAFDDPDWLFEIKYDGYRMLAEFGNGQVELRTRNGARCTDWFPEVAQFLAGFNGPPGTWIVDGEVAVLDDIGRSDFERLHARAARRGYYPGCDPVVYCVFDVLVAAGRNVMNLPLTGRKEILASAWQPKPTKTLLVVQALPADGIDLYRHALSLQLEGLVGKRADSLYHPGTRTSDWRKIKVPGIISPSRFTRLRRGDAR